MPQIAAIPETIESEMTVFSFLPLRRRIQIAIRKTFNRQNIRPIAQPYLTPSKARYQADMILNHAFV